MPAPSGLPFDDVPDLPPVARRFGLYVTFDTQSDPASETFPSTEKQKALGRLLVSELWAMGVEDAEMDDWGYVYATLPSPLPPEEAARLPVVALLAHLDTSPDAPGAGVRPLLHPGYDGGVITLPGGVALDPARQPALAEHVGHTLITSDGTTLLGSDDKAGVAVIMQLAEDLLREDDDLRQRGRRPAPRPTLRLLFTPDEEVGRGTDHLDLHRLGADVAYTLDGSGTDRLNVETFNAAEATVTVEGVGVHPGYAHGVMVNAVTIAAQLVAALPPDEQPETTRGREGYFYPHALSGDTTRAEVRVLLRDFEDDGLARRKALLEDLAARLREEHPRARIEVAFRDSYRNMLRYIEAKDRRVIDVAVEAARAMGFEPAMELIRGGTDGARLSEKGLPTPNVFTGGYDFHSLFEWNTVENLERALEYARRLVLAWGEQLEKGGVGEGEQGG
ncbi:MAG TPA: peptidase T [Rubricoccaceae bacterium]|nr:peptidase T [Rubricoccaceae bacterium]